METTGRDAFVVCDLGFGDSGKGTITDWLVRRTGARLVVRHNGSAQAGHTVVTADGRSHVFAQFGAGSFVEGVRTHLSRFMVVHPTGLLVEASRLAAQGVTDALSRLSVSPQAKVITPFHQAAGRLRELARGQHRHGSCGVGAGETVGDSLEFPEDTLTAGELGDRRRALRKLAAVQQRKWEQMQALRPALSRSDGQVALELGLLGSGDAAERWLEAVRPLLEQVRLADDALPAQGSVVFEGAQGVLLDEWRGFHPYTTWSTCTPHNAMELLRDWDGSVTRLGVLRTYATRHGAGPFPTEDPHLLLDEPHNPTGPWQGAFRRGWPDAVLGRYALSVCGGIDGLALTHLDRLAPRWRLATAYRGGEILPGPPHDLAYQECLGRALASAEPVYQEVKGEAESFMETLEQQLGRPIWVASHGPRAGDKVEKGRLAQASRMPRLGVEISSRA